MQRDFFPLNSHLHKFTALILLLLILQSCKKNIAKPDYPAGTNENINTWILDSLQRYYYWNESLPGKPDLTPDPKSFLNAIRNTADRFSYLILPSDPSTGTVSTRSKYGFDYTTFTEESSGNIIGVIKQVLNDSPASRAGLKRGDYIYQINGKQLNSADAAALQQEVISANKVLLGMDAGPVEINAGATFEQPSISKILQTGNVKTGYLYTNDFNTGLASSLNNTFSNFKNAGVTELILDLRYNSGGQVAEAAGLCTMIAPGITYGTPFITYKGNKNGGAKTESIGTASTFDRSLNFNSLLQRNLDLRRIFILTTGATASAAEIMINNLKPYMQVIVVGEKTRGKDEASFTIADMRNPKQVEWELHPIVYKLFNAAGSGNYSSGIAPDIAVNELSSLPLLALGDTGDPLVQAAINSITGSSNTASVNSKLRTSNLKAGKVLTDTRTLDAANSLVFTHR